MTDYTNTYYKLYEEMSGPQPTLYKEEPKSANPPSTSPPVVAYRFEGPLLNVSPGILNNDESTIRRICVQLLGKRLREMG